MNTIKKDAVNMLLAWAAQWEQNSKAATEKAKAMLSVERKTFAFLSQDGAVEGLGEHTHGLRLSSICKSVLRIVLNSEDGLPIDSDDRKEAKSKAKKAEVNAPPEGYMPMTPETSAKLPTANKGK